jgi:hypothetical protein
MGHSVSTRSYGRRGGADFSNNVLSVTENHSGSQKLLVASVACLGPGRTLPTSSFACRQVIWCAGGTAPSLVPARSRSQTFRAGQRREVPANCVPAGPQGVAYVTGRSRGGARERPASPAVQGQTYHNFRTPAKAAVRPSRSDMMFRCFACWRHQPILRDPDEHISVGCRPGVGREPRSSASARQRNSGLS